MVTRKKSQMIATPVVARMTSAFLAKLVCHLGQLLAGRWRRGITYALLATLAWHQGQLLHGTSAFLAKLACHLGQLPAGHWRREVRLREVLIG